MSPLQNYVAIGDPSGGSAGTGQVYIVRRTTSGWHLHSTLRGSDVSLAGNFGSAVSWNTHLLAIGASSSSSGGVALYRFDTPSSVGFLVPSLLLLLTSLPLFLLPSLSFSALKNILDLRPGTAILFCGSTLQSVRHVGKCSTGSVSCAGVCLLSVGLSDAVCFPPVVVLCALNHKPHSHLIRTLMWATLAAPWCTGWQEPQEIDVSCSFSVLSRPALR